jgi:adenosylcobyric acid synthase
MGRAVMIQGTGSNVGKSMLVAGLVRAARRRGIDVAPFKPQNMSNNAAVTADGGEIGRAQALQALAAGLPPHTDMNPVLLKPETDTGAQVIVQGKRLTRSEAAGLRRAEGAADGAGAGELSRLKAAHDLVIVEGAGSPAEVNLRARDIANMGFAEAAACRSCWPGDIDRGGVIAQIVGTQAVLDLPMRADRGVSHQPVPRRPEALRRRLRADRGADRLAGFGVLPWFADAWRLPAEDALDLDAPDRAEGLHIVCLALSRIANFDDLDPLKQEPGVRLTMLGPGRAIPGDADLVILPGTKSTRGDLAFLRAQGWDIDLRAHVRRGGHVLGICGGYQMLGRSVADPRASRGPAGETKGLGPVGRGR